MAAESGDHGSRMIPAPPICSAGPTADRLGPLSTPPASLPAMTAILLIADGEWVRNDVAAAIADPSTTLEVLDDPDRAVAFASERRFDLVAVDMQVGSTGGMATVRLLRNAMEGGRIERVPIVLLLDRTADVFLAKRAGSDAHLVKPFTSQQVRAVMTDLLAAEGTA